MPADQAAIAYFQSLLAAGLLGSSPAPIPDGVDMTEVYKLSKLHRVDDVVFAALSRLEDKPDFFDRWYKRHCMAISRSATQLYEYGQITSALVAAGARVLPYKGIRLKAFYPEASMRYMSDIDLLYLPPDGDHSRVRAVMESLGYTTEQFDTGVHDVYHKPPVMSVELHRVIFSPDADGYLSNADYMAAATPDADGVLQLPLPHLYFASLTHLVKHLRTDAADLRSVIDLYLLRRAMSGEQHAAADALIRSASLSATDTTLQAVARYLLEGEIPDQNTLDCAQYLLCAIADRSHADAKYLNSYRGKGPVAAGKLRYLLHLVLPGYTYMKKSYPVLGKCPLLLPVLWPWRWLDVLLHQRGRARQAVRRFDGLDRDAAEQEQKILAMFGLK